MLCATVLWHVDMYIDCLVCVVCSIVRLEKGKRVLMKVKGAYPNLSCFGKNLIPSCACILEPGWRLSRQATGTLEIDRKALT